MPRAPIAAGWALALAVLTGACTTAAEPEQRAKPLPPRVSAADHPPAPTRPTDAASAPARRSTCWRGDCASVCGQGDRCRATCSGGGCSQTCEANATCHYTCSGGDCTQVCKPGSTCHLTCSGGGCQRECVAGASCADTCSGGRCRQVGIEPGPRR